MAANAMHVEFPSTLASPPDEDYTLYLSNGTIDGRENLKKISFWDRSINVMAQGATGDGATDDTSAIHSARTAALNGGELVFPPGTYNITGLKATIANQNWRFMHGAKLFLIANSDTQIIEITAAGVHIDGITNADGNSANQGVGNQGIFVNAVDDCWITNSTITDAGQIGIQGLNANGFRVIGCNVIDSVDVAISHSSSSHAFDITGMRIEDNFVDRSGLAVGLAGGGIQVHAQSGNDLVRAVLSNNEILLPSGATNSICIELIYADNCRVSHNRCSGGTMGTSLDDTNYCTITSNTYFNHGDWALECVATNHASFSNNVCDLNNISSSEGVSMSLSSSYNTFSGNTFNGFTGIGMHLQGSGAHNNIGNNTFVSNATDESHIVIDDIDHNTICGNHHHGGGANLKAIELNTSNFATIVGNHFFDIGATSPINIFASDATVYDYYTIVGNTVNPEAAIASVSFTGSATMGDNIVMFGNAGNVRNGKQLNVLDWNNDVIDAWGSGSPESVLNGGIGSTYRDYAGSADAQLYVKETGTGNTGWVAIVVN